MSGSSPEKTSADSSGDAAKRQRSEEAATASGPIARSEVADLLRDLEQRLKADTSAISAAQQRMQAEATAVSQAVDALPSKVLAGVGEQLLALDKGYQTRFGSIEAEVASLRQRITVVEGDKVTQRRETEILATRLVAAEAITVADVRSTDHEAEFNRTPNPALLHVRVAERGAKIGRAQLRVILDQFLAECNIDIAAVDLSGPNLGALFTVNFSKTGTLGVGKIRATTFMDHIRNSGSAGPDGRPQWKVVEVPCPAGGKQRVYFDIDKNQKQEKTEALLRKAKAIAKQYYATHFLKMATVPREGKLYHDWRPLVKVVVDSKDSAHLEWHTVIARELAIDTAAFNAEWSKVGRVDDNVEWSRG